MKKNRDLNKKTKKRMPISLAKVRKAKKMNLPQSLSKEKQIIILVATIIAIVIGVILVTRPNAYEVKVGEEVLGIVKGEQVPKESLDFVIASLKDKYKAEVRVVNEPEVSPVHASRKKLVTADYLISQIKQNVECEIQMIEFVVDGQSKGVFKNKEEVDQLIQKIVNKYIPEDIKEIKEAKLDANIDYKSIYVTEDQLSDPEKVYQQLTQTKEEGKVYSLVSGDNLWVIAEKNDMTVEEIIAINPGITEQTILQIGQELNVKIDKPEVSVKIVEEFKKEEEFMPEPIVTEDADKYVTYRKQVSPGKKGKKEVTVNNIYIDGLLQETINKEIVIKDKGESEKIVVGTKQLPAKAATGKFRSPASGRITSSFGPRWGRMHQGIDIANSYGTAIYASDGGTVKSAGRQGAYGNLVIIDHGNGFETYYGHASKLLVKSGQKVGKGEKIALMGSTGRSTGNHVHFEIRKDGVPKKPSNYI